MASNPALTEIAPIFQDLAALPGWGILPGEALADQEQPATILLVESVPPNLSLLREALQTEGHRITEAAESSEGLAALNRDQVDLVILDLTAQQSRALEICRKIKSSRHTRLIPVLMLSSEEGAESEIAGINSGADAFLVKPVRPEVVRARVRSMLRHKAAVDSLEEAEAILFALAQAVEQRDKATVGHCERLATLSMTLGMALGLPRTQLLALHRGGFLHDIGKISIPDAILFKRGPLTEPEWEVMRTHPSKGEDICRPARTLASVLPIIRSHHERWDGSGYPDHLSGESIPLLARILQVADIFDALTSERPYKGALSSGEALEVLDAEADRGWRDPKLVRLLRKLIETPIETAVMEALIPWPPPESMRRSLENLQQALAK